MRTKWGKVFSAVAAAILAALLMLSNPVQPAGSLSGQDSAGALSFIQPVFRELIPQSQQLFEGNGEAESVAATARSAGAGTESSITVPAGHVESPDAEPLTQPCGPGGGSFPEAEKSAFLCNQMGICGDNCGRYSESSIEPLPVNLEGEAPFQGTFIKLDEIPLAMMSGVIRSLDDLGMTTVIVQNTRSLSARCVTEACCRGSGFNWVEGAVEKLPVLLHSAEAASMEVYVGLVMSSSDLCGRNYFLPPQSERSTADTLTTVRALEADYGSYTAFQGWYLPDEPSLCEMIQPEKMYPYYAQLVAGIHAISARPVLVSPHLCGCDLIGMEAFLRRARTFLDASGADVLLWQDSVGAAGIRPFGLQEFTTAEAYDHLAAALGKEHTWAVVELFNCCVNEVPELAGGVYRPASFSRLLQQIEASSSADHRMVWLYQHHLTSLVPVHHAESGRLAAFYESMIMGPTTLLHPVGYKWLSMPAEVYPDSGDALFDNTTGNAVGVLDAAWVGLPAQDHLAPIVMLDFGETVRIHWIALHLLQREEMGIWFPESIMVECGMESGAWQSMAGWELPGWISRGAGEYVSSNLVPLDIPCRYMQISLENSGWTFLSEIEILGDIGLD